MSDFPKKLHKKITQRKEENAFRQLPEAGDMVDFSSNDYLGFSRSSSIAEQAHALLKEKGIVQNGATGSRLLTGNHQLYLEVEEMLSDVHKSASALVFNSGYDANIGFFSSVPQRGDVILYDEFIHASIRDGLQLSHAKAYKFKHNDLSALEVKCQVEHTCPDRSVGSRSLSGGELFIVTESVFSMDGDSPDLEAMARLAEKHNARLVVDEAHAIGIYGENGTGLVQHLGLTEQVFARIITFGKALGAHGAAVLGSKELISYLVNFARSFIYTTALPQHSLAVILSSYHQMTDENPSSLRSESIIQLKENIQFFKERMKLVVDQNSKLNIQYIESDSAIQCCVIPGNDRVKTIALKLQTEGFDVKPIMSPTVPKGTERLRFCLHSFNNFEEISKVLEILTIFTKKHFVN
ncbi:8-amino-7-oxononanoate synthase [Galbibacter sp. EGI 63066]|uniref:aminotransferase class I/II-fold pyridoxal phosphate-dependent enzyme n=1 Tax=Galbibacter sp. EGI 63066 TaxID=2993559 RepID=UPI002248E6E1|nr:8-amino-7-oxononanoate synthase [Galbibacter sp. EGI 63066]MCX2680514.1 8-amino-7-oxononanoate synthase [Galbibacter sp. EGI 63066]